MNRLLRFTENDTGLLASNAGHKFAAMHALVHYPSGAVYSFIPKNGCTTLRYSLAIGNQCIAGPDEFVWIHANNPTFSADLRELVTAPYSFVILRCPYARLASAFLDKAVSKSHDIWSLRRLVKDSIELDDITFRSFCEILKSARHRKSNIHWRNQSDFLVYRNYDGWFQLEAFEECQRRSKTAPMRRSNSAPFGWFWPEQKRTTLWDVGLSIVPHGEVPLYRNGAVRGCGQTG